MNYYIDKLSEEEYKVSHQGSIDTVNRAFLLDKLKPWKLEELDSTSHVVVRGDWKFESKDTEEHKIEEVDVPENKPKKFKLERKPYIIEESKYSGLYELWKFADGYHFINYFFDLESMDVFIAEDQKWEKYLKKLRRSIHEFDLDPPEKYKEK